MMMKRISATQDQAWKRCSNKHREEKLNRTRDLVTVSATLGTRAFCLVFFLPFVRRSGRPLKTMFTAGVAVCHCRVRRGSENVTRSDDVLWDDWVRREWTENKAICVFALNNQGRMSLIFKRVGGGSLHREQVVPQWHVWSGQWGQNVSRLCYFYLFVLHLCWGCDRSDCHIYVTRAESRRRKYLSHGNLKDWGRSKRRGTVARQTRAYPANIRHQREVHHR